MSIQSFIRSALSSANPGTGGLSPAAFSLGAIRSFGLNSAAVAFAGCLAFIGAAQANVVSLGVISSATELSTGQGGHSGVFSDDYSFSIAAGQSFDFSGLFSTGYSNRSFILDLEGALLQGGQWLQSGVAETKYLPEGFPNREVNFSSLVLGAGDYLIRIDGTATGVYDGITAGYQASLSFADVTAPVPEPDALSLMALGLGAMGFLVRRRGPNAPVARLATRV